MSRKMLAPMMASPFTTPRKRSTRAPSPVGTTVARKKPSSVFENQPMSIPSGPKARSLPWKFSGRLLRDLARRLAEEALQRVGQVGLVGEIELGSDLRRGLPLAQPVCRLVGTRDLLEGLEAEAADLGEMSLDAALVQPLARAAQRPRDHGIALQQALARQRRDEVLDVVEARHLEALGVDPHPSVLFDRALHAAVERHAPRQPGHVDLGPE